jgi:N-sulfoglucosamine sulfohydrolase
LVLADRLEFYLYRAPEEFYNMISDPGSMNNLMGEPTVLPHIQRLQRSLLAWMVNTNDPVTADYAGLLGAP